MKRLHRFDILCAWFEEHLTIKSYRPRTIKDYLFELSFFRRFVKEETDREDIEDIDHDTLYAYTASLYERHLTATTIRCKLGAVQCFFRALYEKHKLYRDITGSIHLPKRIKKLPTGMLNEHEMSEVFTRLEQNTNHHKPIKTYADALAMRDRAVFETLYSTGIRISEITNLDMGDIHDDDSLVHIHGKGGKERIVPVGSVCLEVAHRYLHEARTILAKKECTALFVTYRGGRMSKAALRNVVKRVTTAAGITRNITVHSIRHSCATHMLNNGADIRFVQKQLGHSSLSSTQIYTHVSIKKLKETHRKHHPREQDNFME